MILLFCFLLILCLALITIKLQFFGFKNQDIFGFKNEKNIFDIRDSLNGPLVAEGMIYGLSGQLESTFTARLEGKWENDKGELVENFDFSSGKQQVRAWNLKVLGNGKIEGTALDVVGKARGYQVGSAVKLKYKLKLSEELGGHVINVNDWMHLMDNGTIFNRSEFRKFGIKVGELVATFRKNI